MPLPLNSALGQSDPMSREPAQPVAWSLFADGRSLEWPLSRSFPLDSLAVAARGAVAALQGEGHYFARIDSVQVDSSRTPTEVRFFATKGARVEVGRLGIEGAAAFDSLELIRRMDTRPGRVLDPRLLEADLEALLKHYEAAGFLLTRVQVLDISLLPGDPPRLGITLRIEEGGSPTLQRVEVTGAERTRTSYVARVSGLKKGQPLSGYNAAAIRQRLEATGFFSTVGTPELLIEGDSSAVVHITLDEEAPGAFDLVLGYLPPMGGEGGGSLVGNGHLLLRNLFGSGRLFSLRLNRLPGQVSSVEV
ncbi:MAG: POTRA domain-containing protein, partial [Rhodothermales bacterium]